MITLPKRAQSYIGLTIAAAFALAAGQATELYALTEMLSGWQFAGLCMLTAALSLFRVYGSGNSDHYDISLTIYGFALLVSGEPVTTVLILVGHLVTYLTRRQNWPWYVHLFNCSSLILVTGLAGGIVSLVQGLPGPANALYVGAIVLAIAVFTLVNHVHVAGVLYLSEGVTLRQSRLFTTTSLLVDATMLGVGALCAIVAAVNPYAVVLGAVPLYLNYSVLRLPRLERQARTDAKTGLLQARQFALHAEQELARAKRLNRPLSLVMADLDLLRNINNAHGHLAGDIAIKAVADVLRTSARDDDRVARFGGEEFALLLIEQPMEAALCRAEQIRQAVEAALPTLPNGKTLPLSMSFGVTQRESGDTSLDQLVHRADQALYAAKHAGRNCVRSHQSDAPASEVVLAELLNCAPTSARLQEGHSATTVECAVPAPRPRA
jgi:diguanylate cyclase (GGDEF)-like protein